MPGCAADWLQASQDSLAAWRREHGPQLVPSSWLAGQPTSAEVQAHWDAAGANLGQAFDTLAWGSQPLASK